MLPDSVDEFVHLFWRGTARDRDVARWRMAAIVIQNLSEDYRVARAPHDDDGRELYRGQIDHLRGLERTELCLTLKHDKESATAFGVWRHAVARLEAGNARRLLVLGDTAKFLSDIRERSSSVEVIDQLSHALAHWLASEWRTDVPLQSDLRVWAIRQTRLPDLCPNEWRTIWI